MAKFLCIVLTLWAAVLSRESSAELAHYIKFYRDHSGSCLILEDAPGIYRGFSSDPNEVVTFAKSAIHVPGDDIGDIDDDSQIIEIFSREQDIAEAHADAFCQRRSQVQPLDPSKVTATPEVLKIIDGGDQANRIDVVFMGDGYQAQEREEFFEDMRRLTKEMFEGVTFRSYLPLFNIWAIYEESVDSGIGYNSKPKNTPFGLTRSGNTLRGIYPGKAGHAREVCRLTGTSGCDYPSIIGNDDFYGGLGGEFVISTRSNRTGTVVLRHEMGHNFADVGEEYDNGGVYRGVNSARTVNGLGWTTWLTTPGGIPREERSTYRLLQYPWADLANGAKSYTFRSDGTYHRWQLTVSVSAAGEEDSLEFLLDGEALPWKTSGFDDREFYEWAGDEGFTAGEHSFSVRSKTPSTHPDIPRMICSIRLHEYGNEEEYHMSNDYVSAYPTFGSGGSITYRPTSAGCLMRNMTYTKFCPVCQEGIWSQFLRRVSLIDSVQVLPEANPDGSKAVILHTLKLGALRDAGNEVEGEKLGVLWARNGREEEGLRDKFVVAALPGSWTVTVNFTTPEVRHDPQGLLTDSREFVI